MIVAEREWKADLSDGFYYVRLSQRGTRGQRQQLEIGGVRNVPARPVSRSLVKNLKVHAGRGRLRTIRTQSQVGRGTSKVSYKDSYKIRDCPLYDLRDRLGCGLITNDNRRKNGECRRRIRWTSLQELKAVKDRLPADAEAQRILGEYVASGFSRPDLGNRKLYLKGKAERQEREQREREKEQSRRLAYPAPTIVLPATMGPPQEWSDTLRSRLVNGRLRRRVRPSPQPAPSLGEKGRSL
jgi:hypothetical protein